jgi:hypothetical protein
MDTTTIRLREGDRIQLIHPITGVVAGTQGTILQAFAFDSFYDICFDGYAIPRLVNKWDLAPTSQEAPMARAHTPATHERPR